MCKSKWNNVKDNFDKIEKWCRDGLTEEQISKNIGISEATLNIYKHSHPELVELLKNSRTSFIIEVENALAKRALGFNYTETEKIITKRNDNTIRTQIKTLEKYMPPDVAACNVLLKNKDKHNWCDNPQKQMLEREKLELEKQIFEYKKQIDEMKLNPICEEEDDNFIEAMKTVSKDVWGDADADAEDAE